MPLEVIQDLLAPKVRVRQNALSLVVAQGDHVQRVDRDDVVAVQHQVVDRLYRDLLWRVEVGWEDPLSIGARLDGMPWGKRHALHLDDIGKLAFGDRSIDKSLHGGDRSVSTCDLVPALKVLYAGFLSPLAIWTSPSPSKQGP